MKLVKPPGRCAAGFRISLVAWYRRVACSGRDSWVPRSVFGQDSLFQPDFGLVVSDLGTIFNQFQSYNGMMIPIDIHRVFDPFQAELTILATAAAQTMLTVDGWAVSSMLRRQAAPWFPLKMGQPPKSGGI